MTYYYDSFKRTNKVDDLHSNFAHLSENETNVSIAGRVMAKRSMGKMIFFDLCDDSGRIQCLCAKTEVAAETFTEVKTELKVGDIVGLSGSLFKTRTEENTVKVSGFTMLSKSLKDLPEKFHGISNQELRYRKRYLDLIMNESTRNVFQKRFEMLRILREFLTDHEFVEVETPIFQSSPCGASANPFKTHHDALNLDMYLRISPETFLKQLVVGGMEKVFEIGKNFRNEGLGPSHLQEFTMLEYYVSYWNYRDNMEFIQKLLRHILMETCGTLHIDYQGITFDFESPWEVVVYAERLEADTGIDVLAFDNADDLRAEIKRKCIDLGDVSDISLGNLIDKLYKKCTRPNLIQPTLLVHHPASLIPLARLNDDDPRVIDSFQVLINGWEVVKAYSELADPVLQRKLLEDQAGMRDAGDDEAMFLDEAFIESLEYAMPPVSGLGLGIDRLIALITDQKSLRDVVLFPIMK